MAPPPDRDLSTSSTARRPARTPRSTSGCSRAARRRQSATQGQATLDPVEGSFLVGASPFGAYWYPVRPLGDAVIRLQYTVQDTPTSTRNGGVMIRSPEVRYTGATTAEVLAQKPTGYNYERVPGGDPGVRAADPGGLDDLFVGGRRWPVPARLGRVGPAVPVLGCLLRPHGHAQRHEPGRHRRADDQQQCEQPPALDAGLLRARDADQRDADRWRPAAVGRSDQDGLGVRVPQPERQAVKDQRAARPRASGTTWRSARSASSTRC